jgi:hypothetical protein
VRRIKTPLRSISGVRLITNFANKEVIAGQATTPGSRSERATYRFVVHRYGKSIDLGCQPGSNSFVFGLLDTLRGSPPSAFMT